MSQKSSRTRELCQSYLAILDAAGINPMIIDTYRRLIRSHRSSNATAAEHFRTAFTLREQLGAVTAVNKALLAEIEAMHEANAGAAL